MTEGELTDRGSARIGTILRGKYRIDRVLGVGGMAVVYAVTHRNTKQFALKMLHAEFASRPEWNARFQREGYVANSVQHPGAVTVIDDDVAEDGSAFLVMELLEGAGVETIWEQHGGRLPPKPVLALAHQLLDVLAAAHAKSIVHRDIKPANLFVTASGALKVLDFGTARLREPSSTSATVTHGGVLLGTPAFMPPEQAMGLTNEVDAQTDIWAVGATLFTLLAGAYVHEGKTAQHIAVLSATEPARSLGVAAPNLPPEVVALVDRALAFDKKDRWPSAAAMRDAARDAYLNLFGEVVSSAPLATLAFDGSPTLVTGKGENARSSSPHAHAPTVRADSGSSAPHLAGLAASQSTSWGETQESPAVPPPPKSRLLPVLIGAAALVAIGTIAYVGLTPRQHGDASGGVARGSASSLSVAPIPSSSTPSADVAPAETPSATTSAPTPTAVASATASTPRSGIRPTPLPLPARSARPTSPVSTIDPGSVR